MLISTFNLLADKDRTMNRIVFMCKELFIYDYMQHSQPFQIDIERYAQDQYGGKKLLIFPLATGSKRE